MDDVEEFFSKTQQISVCNVKGIVVSTNSFPESAFKFSQSKGIGLLRYYDRENLDWILNRSPSSMTSSSNTDWCITYNALHDQGHVSRYFDCYGFIDEIYTNLSKVDARAKQKKGFEEFFLWYQLDQNA